MAKIELSVLSQQCLPRRIAALETVRHEAQAWEYERHATQPGVDWRLTTAEARMKLKRLSPP